jgi:LacI family transcriptional regulator
MAKKITIQDIARKANVSKSTVSRVLNDSTPVNAGKRKAVLDAMSKLNFKPNLFAQGLAGGRSMTVGILTQNIGSPFYDRVTQGITSGLSGSRYSPIFVDGQWQGEAEQAAIETLLGRQVDGLVIVGGTMSREVLQGVGQQKPLIIAARDVPGLEHHCIYVDNRQAAYDATKFLIDAGHKDIAHITGIKTHQDAVRRHKGYLQALNDAGIEPNDQLVVEGNFSGQSGVLAAETLLMRGSAFTAIFAGNDESAFGARLALYRRGIRVPDDVSILGFDDQPNSSFMTPPLTTIRQPAFEIGQAAAEAVLNILDGKPFVLPQLNTELVVRESVMHRR